MNTMDKLKKKYWEGATSASEEEILKRHSENKEDEPVEDVFFSYLEHKRKEKINDPAFDADVLRQITQNQGTKRSLFQRINWQIAAAIAILFAIGTIYIVRQVGTNNSTGQQNTSLLADTFEDPQLAFEETKKALLLISNNLNKSKVYAAEFKKFNESQEKLKKQN